MNRSQPPHRLLPARLRAALLPAVLLAAAQGCALTGSPEREALRRGTAPLAGTATRLAGALADEAGRAAGAAGTARVLAEGETSGRRLESGAGSARVLLAGEVQRPPDAAAAALRLAGPAELARAGRGGLADPPPALRPARELQRVSRAASTGARLWSREQRWWVREEDARMVPASPFRESLRLLWR